MWPSGPAFVAAHVQCAEVGVENRMQRQCTFGTMSQRHVSPSACQLPGSLPCMPHAVPYHLQLETCRSGLLTPERLQRQPVQSPFSETSCFSTLDPTGHFGVLWHCQSLSSHEQEDFRMASTDLRFKALKEDVSRKSILGALLRPSCSLSGLNIHCSRSRAADGGAACSV